MRNFNGRAAAQEGRQPQHMMPGRGGTQTQALSSVNFWVWKFEKVHRKYKQLSLKKLPVSVI
jgi:hypothetical protein